MPAVPPPPIATPASQVSSACGKGGAQPVEHADAGRRIALGRPGADHLARGVGQRADDGDAALAAGQRQQVAVVLQQHDRSGRRLAGERPRQGRLGKLAAPIGVGEQPEPLLEAQHPAHAHVDLRLRAEASRDGVRQVVDVGVAHHVDVAAGADAQRRRLRLVGGGAVVDQLAHGAVVADDQPVEPEPSAQPVVQQLAVGGHRDAVQRVQRRHDRGDAGAHRRLERRQVHLAHRARRHVGGRVFASREHAAVAAEVLGAAGEPVDRLQARRLVAARLGLAEARVEPGIFAGALDGAAPARVARHVDHRREGDVLPVGRRLDRGGARGALPQVGIEGAGLGDRHREQGAVAVDHVVAEEQRDLQPRFLHRHALHGGDLGRADEVDETADLAVAHRVGGVARGDGARQRRAPGQHVELPGLLGEGHGGDQCVDVGQASASFRSGSGRKGEPRRRRPS